MVTKNKLNIRLGGYGLYVYYCYGTGSNMGLIANNFISLSGTSTAYGIYSYNSSYINYYYNNIYNNSTGSGSNNSCFYIYYGSNQNLKNNIFCNKGRGYAIYAGSTYSMSNSDYNDLFTSGSLYCYYSGDRSSLALWKSATSMDNHSISADPIFYSTSDLHVKEISLNRAGSPISGITDDIDGESRNSTNPDIGADEFTPPANDAGVISLANPVKPFASDTQLIKVRIRNFGNDT